MKWLPDEILETLRMTQMEHLDIRTVTLGISLRDCIDSDLERMKARVYDKLLKLAGNLVPTAESIERELGISIVNKRISLTPVAIIGENFDEEGYFQLGQVIDEAGAELGVDYIGGFSALVQKDWTKGDRALIATIPRALSQTKRLCSSVNLASTTAGINMNAVLRMAEVIKELASLTASKGAIGCAKLVVFANAPEDNPFIAGAFHGVGEGDCALNVGISGPGVIRAVLEKIGNVDLMMLAEMIKRTSFKITRMGELVGRRVSENLGVPFGIVDLSLAPTPALGDSVADILERMGLEKAGTHGTIAALAMLTDAVKKGGLMASSSVGGLSGAFVPVSEDAGMINAVAEGALSLDKLEAMTSVCSVGLDMIAVPGDTPVESIAGIIADEMAIGVMNHKTTGVRIIPVPGKIEGDFIDYGGLLGRAPIMSVNKFSSKAFIMRGGRIPAPIQGYRN